MFGSKVNNKQYFHMKNSLSMKKLSINNFTTKLLSTFLMDPYIKITKKFGCKVINRQHFHRKTGLKMNVYKIPFMYFNLLT